MDHAVPIVDSVFSTRNFNRHFLDSSMIRVVDDVGQLTTLHTADALIGLAFIRLTSDTLFQSSVLWSNYS